MWGVLFSMTSVVLGEEDSGPGKQTLLSFKVSILYLRDWGSFAVSEGHGLRTQMVDSQGHMAEMIGILDICKEPAWTVWRGPLSSCSLNWSPAASSKHYPRWC